MGHKVIAAVFLNPADSFSSSWKVYHGYLYFPSSDRLPEDRFFLRGLEGSSTDERIARVCVRVRGRQQPCLPLTFPTLSLVTVFREANWGEVRSSLVFLRKQMVCSWPGGDVSSPSHAGDFFNYRCSTFNQIKEERSQGRTGQRGRTNHRTHTLGGCTSACSLQYIDLFNRALNVSRRPEVLPQPVPASF